MSCLNALAIVAGLKLRLCCVVLTILLQFCGNSYTHFLSLSHFKTLKSDWRQSAEFAEAGVVYLYAHGSFSCKHGRSPFWVHFIVLTMLSQYKTHVDQNARCAIVLLLSHHKLEGIIGACLQIRFCGPKKTPACYIV